MRQRSQEAAAPSGVGAAGAVAGNSATHPGAVTTRGARRPAALAFDVVGTLFSLDPLKSRLRDAGLPEQALETWFARFLRDAIALDVAGRFVPFREVAAATLDVLVAEQP